MASAFGHGSVKMVHFTDRDIRHTLIQIDFEYTVSDQRTEIAGKHAMMMGAPLAAAPSSLALHL